ncbi:MAG: hypothetical protein L0H93_16305 [Nocardioides sp.]|nr:hypothetical protein [Nocardioides sp.]
MKRPAPGATRPEHALDDWKSIQFTKMQGKKVEVDPIDLDGSRALGVQSWATTEAGHHVTYHEFMTVHDGSLHAFHLHLTRAVRDLDHRSARHD